ncbi:hypothetical protein [Prochlorothrix hollandica]|uniref:hypothetical protein n=1 Tax=Prochlorothrix hollandica TaxID=1223 RepID=UPI00034A85DB|nr:hypothetical protein [Prochlorothrix hollandica]
MKLVCILPDKAEYSPLQSTTPGRWIFTDKANDKLRIQSPTPNPWGKEWKIVTSMKMQKSDGSQYPYGLDLKLFPPDGEGIPVNLDREIIKGAFAWTKEPATFFCVFPTGKQFFWLCYSFTKR